MSDLYDTLFSEKENANKTFFFTDEDGRVRFARGPCMGGGTADGGNIINSSKTDTTLI